MQDPADIHGDLTLANDCCHAGIGHAGDAGHMQVLLELFDVGALHITAGGLRTDYAVQHRFKITAADMLDALAQGIRLQQHP